MFESSFVVLREIAELLLIALAIRTYLARIGRDDLASCILAGAALGIGAGAVAFAVILNYVHHPSAEAWLSVILGFAVLAMGIAMLSSRPAIDRHVRNLLQDRLDGRVGALAIAGLAGLAATRETLETAIFLRSAALDHGLAEAMWGSVLGVVMGTAVACAYRSIKSRVPLLAVFRLSTLLLCLIAIQLILEGAAGLVASVPGEQGHGEPPLMEVLTPGHPLYPYLCAALMVAPLVLMVRHWWREARS